MVTLAWRMLRQRPASGLATLLAVWCAVTVVTGCGVLLESGLRYHGTPQMPAVPSPALGADTEAVLGELLGLSPADVADLRADGTV